MTDYWLKRRKRFNGTFCVGKMWKTKSHFHLLESAAGGVQMWYVILTYSGRSLWSLRSSGSWWASHILFWNIYPSPPLEQTRRNHVKFRPANRNVPLSLGSQANIVEITKNSSRVRFVMYFYGQERRWLYGDCWTRTRAAKTSATSSRCQYRPNCSVNSFTPGCVTEAAVCGSKWRQQGHSISCWNTQWAISPLILWPERGRKQLLLNYC